MSQRSKPIILRLSRVLLCLGVGFSAVSIYQTLVLAFDPAFQAPALPLGPRHTNYHAFRGFTLAFGTVIIMLFVMFQPAQRRQPVLWTIMLLSALFYYGGWWLPWPLLGLHTPNLAAGVDHGLATFFSLAGILLARGEFNVRDCQER
ncbi:MAG: hypothetical protein V7L25_08025 [Nostoc sp.]|uniref:hypothetical protein n=1 Tax=Nostoc sp. TaxID=1180 RepID=UPI002FF1F228